MSQLDPLAVIKRRLEHLADELSNSQPEAGHVEPADLDDSSFCEGWESGTSHAAVCLRDLASAITIEGEK